MEEYIGRVGKGGSGMAQKKLKKRAKAAIRQWVRRIKGRRNSRCASETARRWLGLPYAYIGRGRNRIVYDLKNGAILKVAVTRKGIRNNEMEEQLYASVSPSVQKHLAKVIDRGRGWIIMQKVHRRVSRNAKNARRVHAMIRKFEKQGIKVMDLVSGTNRIKWKNVGRIRNKLVVLDYGKFSIRRRVRTASCETAVMEADRTDPSFENERRVSLCRRINSSFCRGGDGLRSSDRS